MAFRTAANLQHQHSSNSSGIAGEDESAEFLLTGSLRLQCSPPKRRPESSPAAIDLELIDQQATPLVHSIQRLLHRVCQLEETANTTGDSAAVTYPDGATDNQEDTDVHSLESCRQKRAVGPSKTIMGSMQGSPAKKTLVQLQDMIADMEALCTRSKSRPDEERTESATSRQDSLRYRNTSNKHARQPHMLSHRGRHLKDSEVCEPLVESERLLAAGEMMYKSNRQRPRSPGRSDIVLAAPPGMVADHSFQSCCTESISFQYMHVLVSILFRSHCYPWCSDMQL